MTRRFPLVNLEGLAWYVAGRPPPAAAIAAVRTALHSAGGVWHVEGHGVGDTASLLTASKSFFDQPAASKRLFSVGDMDRSRGWEMYPQHMKFHRTWMARYVQDAFPHAGEPSSAEGIMCERFVCGPPSVCNQDTRAPHAAHPFYSSDWGKVFYERNVWPDGSMRAEMEATYPKLERVALACVQLVAAALGADHTAFEQLVTPSSTAHPEAPLRHHSRLQVNNYPSQLRRRRELESPIRASRHYDTSFLTVLCREPSVENEGLASPGTSGALEVFLDAEQRWVCVPASDGECTVFLGNLAALLTGFAIQGTTHRVSNPRHHCSTNRRRLSIGFNLKPDYLIPACPPPAVREALPWLPAVAPEEVPLIGLVGRVGWQNHAMLTLGLTRLQAVASFKSWKNETVARLRAEPRTECLGMAWAGRT